VNAVVQARALVPADLPSPSPSQTGRHRLSRWWDQVSIYLPVLLMMLLALASYWLLRATPQPEPPAPKREVSHEPDYFMHRFSVKVFEPGGALKTELYGTQARHHPDVGSMVVESARIRSFGPQRQLSTATARQITSNDEGTVFVLEGEASVVRQASRGPTGEPLPRIEFHGEYLRVSTEPEHIMSDRPIVLVRGQDQITANALEYLGDARVAVLTGQVRARFAPRP
jgi:lipopolysaccharide export system protein LptC